MMSCARADRRGDKEIGAAPLQGAGEGGVATLEDLDDAAGPLAGLRNGTARVRADDEA